MLGTGLVDTPTAEQIMPLTFDVRWHLETLHSAWMAYLSIESRAFEEAAYLKCGLGDPDPLDDEDTALRHFLEEHGPFCGPLSVQSTRESDRAEFLQSLHQRQWIQVHTGRPILRDVTFGAQEALLFAEVVGEEHGL